MKKHWSLITLAALALAAGCAKEAVEPVTPLAQEEAKPLEIKYVPGIVVLKLDESTTARAEQDADAVAAELGFDYMERLFPHAGVFEPRTRKEGLHRYYRAHLQADAPVTKAAGDASAMPGVEMAHPIRPVVTRALPNDPYFGMQWHYYNESYPGADINVRKVWEEFTTGSDRVIVSVVDDGVNLNHEDLAGQVVPNYTDKTGSWNFCYNSPNLQASSYHGTHVAGTIAAITNNGKGVAGIAGGDAAKGIPGARILSCQIFGGTEVYLFDAIKHGADHGAVILQCSWGFSPDMDGDGFTSDEEIALYRSYTIDDLPEYKDAIDYFIKYAGCDNDGNQLPDSPMKGGLAIFASGNDNFDYDPMVSYEPIIAVGAFGLTGAKASYSNYGDWLDIAAPGGESKRGIYSTLVNGYGGVDIIGTSMACPHVSGVAALLVSYFGKQPGFTAEECKTRLLRGAVDNAFPGTRYIGRKLDAYGAFTYDMGAKPGVPAIEWDEALKDSYTLLYNQSLEIPFQVKDPVNQCYDIRITPETEGVSLGRAESGHRTLVLDGAAVPVGEHTLTLEVTNESGLKATAAVKVSAPGNRAPVWDGLPGTVALTPHAQPFVLDLSSLMSDPDGDPLTVEMSGANAAVAKAVLEDNVLTVTPQGDGEMELVLTLSDGALRSEASILVVVATPDGEVALAETRVTESLGLSVGTEEETQVDVSIYSSTGTCVFHEVVSGSVFNPVTLDLSGLAPGRYVLVAVYADRTEKQSFVKY